MTSPTATCPVAPIGQQFNPFAPDHLEDPFPFYELARRQEPVFFSPALGMWVVTRYGDARAVVNQPALFSSRDSIKSIAPVCPAAQAVLAAGVPPTSTVVDSDRPGHARWRKVIAGGFAASRMRRLEPQIREITNARIDAIDAFRHGDVVADLTFPIPLQGIARLCDIGDEHCDNLRRWSQSLISLVSSVMAPERQVEVAHDLVDFQAFMADQIASKRAEPGADIISDLPSADGDQPFTENELITQMMNLFVAGHAGPGHPHLAGPSAGAYHLFRPVPPRSVRVDQTLEGTVEGPSRPAARFVCRPVRGDAARRRPGDRRGQTS